MSTTSHIYIGLMSGTSLDGVDIAIVDFSGHPPEIIYCDTKSYNSDICEKLRELIRAKTISLDDLCRLDINVARFYADLVNQALKDRQIDTDVIRAIGCHGQTIRHSPRIEPIYTLQIGDPNTLAARTGITTVADFRRRDMAFGGQGAPLASAFHQYLFRSPQSDRAIINIGGIANISYLPADVDAPVIGFDTGPGNTLLDYWINLHQNFNFDRNGRWAASGQVVDQLLKNMLNTEPYFHQTYPKSTGTEYFCPNWLHQFLDKEDYQPADIQATLIALTVNTIARGLQQLPHQPSQCYVSGGGAHNQQIMEKLGVLLENCELASTQSVGIDPDYVEAVAFAWLAQESLNLRPGNLPSVTCADSSTILGGIYPVATNT